MLKEIREHFFAYLVLFIFLVAFGYFYIKYYHIAEVARLLAFALSFFYFSWGVITHLKAGKVHYKILAEYLSISLLVGSLLALLTF